MIQYEGLCLGGPYDGERRVCNSPRMETYERTERFMSTYDAMCSGDLSAAMATTRQVTYVHQCFKAAGKDFGFWIMLDYLQRARDVGPRDVVERLIENYRPVTRWHGRDVVRVNGETHLLHKV